VSAAGGSVAAFKINFFQISGRTGDVTAVASPARSRASASSSARPASPSTNVPTKVGWSAGCSTTPGSTVSPLLSVTPTTTCSGGKAEASHTEANLHKSTRGQSPSSVNVLARLA
jgi:hypothetical protein